MAIRIVSKHDGFRRCGVAHSIAPREWNDEDFTAEELLILQAEPMLFVTVTKDKPAKAKAE